jgi:hypothetical protein
MHLPWQVVVGQWIAGAIDAFLLKIMLEEDLGFPVRLVLDDDPALTRECCSPSPGTCTKDGVPMKPAAMSEFCVPAVWEALKAGVAQLYPEVAAPLWLRHATCKRTTYNTRRATFTGRTPGARGRHRPMAAASHAPPYSAQNGMLGSESGSARSARAQTQRTRSCKVRS